MWNDFWSIMKPAYFIIWFSFNINFRFSIKGPKRLYSINVWSTPAVWKQYNKMAVLHFCLVNSSLYILFSLALAADNNYYAQVTFVENTQLRILRFWSYKHRYLNHTTDNALKGKVGTGSKNWYLNQVLLSLINIREKNNAEFSKKN